MHGIQSWVALPKTHEQIEPSFSHQPKSALPVIATPGVEMRLIVGTAFGQGAPTPSYSDIFYLAFTGSDQRGPLPPCDAHRECFIANFGDDRSARAARRLIFHSPPARVC